MMRPDQYRPTGRQRPSAARRGYDHVWRRIRAAHLRRHPLCALCGRPAAVVDHVQPHRLSFLESRAAWQLARDPANLQSLCTTCHNAKTRSGL